MDMHLIHPLDSDSIKQFTGMRHLSLMSVFHVAVEMHNFEDSVSSEARR
jgi:hypothetical protein